MIQGGFDMTKKIKTEEVDRISDLPELMVHHIFLFLSFKEIVQTCVLSKRWEKAWNSHPVLEFDGTIFGRDLWDPYPYNYVKLKDIQNRRLKLFNCLEQILRVRHCREMTSITKFTLEVDIYNDVEFVSFVERCICYALGSNVKELKLKFGFWHGFFNLPEIVLCAKSVVRLELRSCTLKLPRSNMNLSSLKKLSLWNVYADDRVIKNIVGGIPLIEEMSFRDCKGLTSLDLFGLDRLIDISLLQDFELKRVSIKAMNLHSFEIYAPTALYEINVDYCKNLKRLSLGGISIKDEWLCNLVRKLQLLEYLGIGSCDDLESVKISCPTLKTLQISECSNLVELKIDTPNLSVLHYWGDMISFSSNALSLSDIDIELNPKKFDTEWYIKYIELVAQLHHFSDSLVLDVSSGEEVIVPKNLRHTLSSPLSNGKHLFLEFNKEPLTHQVSNIVDGLLWILPHTKNAPIISSLVYSFQFSYKKDIIYEGKTARCCKSLPISCWQHCIKEVTLEVSCGTILNESDRQTHSYSLEGADILEKIDACCAIARSEIVARFR
ncbi:hypothetical protein EZV62_003706 [Acer yangbiense]|uniref:F-box domain-containing protein n=1 Tax=Acer yangbiense TaxID=1000413 RepID=A0A5C7II15_9ROSI|nr:hypothetical protein EZV62_003706 [Acer yangbiense]